MERVRKRKPNRRPRRPRRGRMYIFDRWSVEGRGGGGGYYGEGMAGEVLRVGRNLGGM